MNPELRRMTKADIPFGMHLKNQAGWNQTEADWHRFLDLEPEGCFLALWDGQPVATSTTCLLGSVGWIAMVLVDEPFRHRGVGTRMVKNACAYLDARGARSVRLDATPLGQPVYQRLGFSVEYALIRFESSAPRLAPSPRRCDAVRAADVPTLADLDRQITGTDRSRLVARLLSEFAASAAIVPGTRDPAGYAILRPGSRARQAGPVIARTSAAGRQLLLWACGASADQPMYVDVPECNADAVQTLCSAGFREQRRLTRMVRGQAVRDVPGKIWASSGPEKG